MREIIGLLATVSDRLGEMDEGELDEVRALVHWTTKIQRVLDVLEIERLTNGEWSDEGSP